MHPSKTSYTLHRFVAASRYKLFCPNEVLLWKSTTSTHPTSRRTTTYVLCIKKIMFCAFIPFLYLLRKA